MASRGNSRARNEIIELLKDDHRRVKKAFKAAQKMDPEEDAEDLQALVDETLDDLEIHARLEEELFYPAARESLKDENLIEEAEVEHASAKMLIAQLRGMTPDDPKYMATFKVLGEYVQHHVKEEENELFEQLSSGRSKVRWEELQQQMLTMRETLLVEMGYGEVEMEDEEEEASTPSRGRGRSRSERSADAEETVD